MELNGRSRRLVAVFVAGCVIGLCATCYVSMSGGLGGGAASGSAENHRMSLANPRIVISKDERELRLYSGSRMVRCYHIGLGPRPAGHKLKEGDGRTPEGQYYVCTKNPRSRYYLSLGLSYPNIGDAERGLREGVITRRQYEAIAEAVRAGTTPLWNTGLGGEIFVHGNGAGSDWTLGCIALDNGDMRELYDAVEVGTAVTIVGGKAGGAGSEAFANAVNADRPIIAIQSRIDGGQWKHDKAIYPLKGQGVTLRVDEVPGAAVRWYEIAADISKNYKNANWPWEEEPYKWVGLAKIDYRREELRRFRGLRQVRLFDEEAGNCRFHGGRAGSFWFQVEVAKEGVVYRSAGIEDGDHRGLSPRVFRVSVRDGEGYLGYVTSFFNVPGLFGSVTYQSNNYIGVDCADVLMAAYGKWRGKAMEKNYNVAMLVNKWPKVKEFNLSGGRPDRAVRWDSDVYAGDLIAVRYRGGRQYQHIGALYEDANKNGVLDEEDVVVHAGPGPLHCSRLKEGSFDGHVVILRPYSARDRHGFAAP